MPVNQARPAVVWAGVVVLLLGVVPASAHAQNLVSNGGFESGITGWTLNANDCASFVNDVHTGPGFSGVFIPPPGIAHSGAGEFAFGAVSCTPGISQALATTFGQAYILSFWIALDPAPLEIPNLFQLLINGSVLAQTQIMHTPWHEVSFVIVGTGNDVLGFAGNNPNGVSYLDDVSVTAVSPEPATMTLLASGLVGLFAAQRRRRKK